MHGSAHRPKISVITATRNAAGTISSLYESLRQQKYTNFEWIVADGLSNDSTVSLLQEFAGRSSWLKFVSEPDFGIYHALNKALALAGGEYYLVAGADDVLNENALTRYAEFSGNGTVDVVLARVVRAGKVIGGFRPHLSWISPAKAFPGSHSVGMLFRANLHARFGWYSQQFPLLADSYFLKLLLQSGSVRFADADFVAGTFAEGGMTTRRKVQILAETWQIQMLTERTPLLQTLLFLGKFLVRYPAVLNEIRHRSVSSGT